MSMTETAVRRLATFDLETETTTINVAHRNKPIPVDRHRPVITLPGSEPPVVGDWHTPEADNRTSREAVRRDALAAGTRLAAQTVRDLETVDGFQIGNIGQPS